MAVYTVARDHVRSDVMQAARDFITGTNSEYVVFPVSGYEVNVILGDWDYSDYTFEHGEVYSISYVPTLNDVPYYIRLTKSASDVSGSLSNPYGVLTYSSAPRSAKLCDKGGVLLGTVSAFGVAMLLCWAIVRDIFSNVSRH